MITRRVTAASLALAFVATASGFAATSPFASAAPPAAYTGTNAAEDGPGTCLNGPGDVNCNIYTAKQHVWLNAGPAATSTGFGDGEYFFVVLEPGGGVNDDDSGNLSDEMGVPGGDAYTNRVFTISGGVATYSGSHTVTGNASASAKIRLVPYDDTSNPGGEYRIAICRLGDVGSTADDWDYPAGSNQCKRDNFKVLEGPTDVGGEVFPPTVTKNVVATYDDQYTWAITKAAGTPTVVSGDVTIPYTVTVTPSGPTPTNYELGGTIEVTNLNDFPITVAISDSVDGLTCDLAGEADLSGGGTALVVDGSVTVPDQSEANVDYTCPVTGPSGAAEPANTVTITWGEIGDLPAGSAFDTVPYEYALDDTIDKCVTVTDAFDGGLATSIGAGTYCAASGPIAYTNNAHVRLGQCRTIANTAAFTTNDSEATGTASASVTACGPNGLTMGFWQNKNGQGLIKGGTATAGVCNSGTYLRTLAPFQDLSATASCSGVATYVTSMIKAADAAGASMNKMLKAQMLATALDVYFSATNTQFFSGPIGGYTVDLTNICVGGYPANPCNVTSAFGGMGSMTVSQMLAYAANQSNVGGSVWYGQVKATQEKAKNAFDAINNSKV